MGGGGVEIGAERQISAVSGQSRLPNSYLLFVLRKNATGKRVDNEPEEPNLFFDINRPAIHRHRY